MQKNKHPRRRQTRKTRGIQAIILGLRLLTIGIITLLIFLLGSRTSTGAMVVDTQKGSIVGISTVALVVSLTALYLLTQRE